MRLIDEDVTLNAVSHIEKPKGVPQVAFESTMFKVCKAIMDVPIEQAVPRRYGFWVEEKDRERHWHCSICHKVVGITSQDMDFCPYCGSVMKRSESSDKT